MKPLLAILFCVVYAAADKLDNVAHKGYGRHTPDNPLELPLPSEDNVVLVPPPQPVVEEDATMDPLKMLMMVVPGTPGVDYPILDVIPETSFKCEDVATAPFGYYADTDPASRCQVFHVCNENIKNSFLCHNGSLFNQQAFVCDWWFNVDCAKQKEYYGLNKEIGVIPLPANAGSGSSASNGSGNSGSASGSSAGASSNSLEEAPSKVEPVIAEPENSYLPPPPSDTYLPPATSYLPPN